MSLANLYLLRIVQIDVYLEILQFAVRHSRDPLWYKTESNKLFEERKNIRRFLNMTELWRLRNVN